MDTRWDEKNEEEISTPCSGLLVCVYLEDITLCRVITMFLYSLIEQDAMASFYMFIPATQSIFAMQDQKWNKHLREYSALLFGVVVQLQLLLRLRRHLACVASKLWCRKIRCIPMKKKASDWIVEHSTGTQTVATSCSMKTLYTPSSALM